MSKVSWLLAAAAIIGLLVRLLKTDKLDGLLARFGLPSIPKRALPWIALALGAAAGGIQVYLNPSTDVATLVADLLNGLVAGAAPIAVHELSTDRGQ